MSITLVSPRETELQKQVIELAESLRNLGWEFELYKQGARATHQKLLDQIMELKAKLAETELDYERFRVDYNEKSLSMTTVPNQRVPEIYNSHHASQMATPLGGTP